MEELLERYDPAEFYDDYVRAFIDENISRDVLRKTYDAYEQATANGDEDRAFVFYLSEYGFVNGTRIMSFEDFSDNEFPKLAMEIEQEKVECNTDLIKSKKKTASKESERE